MTTIHDPTAYEIHFFAIPPVREAKKLQTLCDFLNTAAAEFAKTVRRDPPYRITQLEDFTDLTSDRLTIVEHTKVSSGAALELEVRTLHDAVMLRTVVLHEKSFELEQVKHLSFSTSLPQPREEVPGYLGVFRVRSVETDQHAKWAKVGKALAADCGWPWLAEAEPVVMPLGAMLFGVPPRKSHQRLEHVLDLIFVSGRDSAEIDESHPLDPFLLMLPELALCHLKVRNSVENIRNWLPNVAERERQLRDLLPKRGEGNQPHLQMLERNDEITERQAELVDAVERVRAELRTIHVNRDNFAATAAAQPFERSADKLKDLLIDRWMRGLELQAKNDIGYVKGALRLAKTHFKSIEASAAADQARYLQRINRLVIILGGLTLAATVLIGLAQIYLAWKGLPTPTSGK